MHTADTSSVLDTKLNKWLYWFASSIFPVVVALFLYNQNSQYLDFKYFAIVAAGFFIAGVLTYTVLSLLVRSLRAALLASVLLWILFFNAVSLYHALYVIIPRSKPLFAVTALILIALGYWAITAIVHKVRSSGWFQAFSYVIILLFVFNVYTTISAKIKQTTFVNAKTDFTVNTEAPHPNIYWFHMDGMIGFTAYSKYFGDGQPEFVDYLESNGFVVNKDASFEATHKTAVAIPALMSPSFYDEQMLNVLKTVDKFDSPARSDGVNSIRRSLVGDNDALFLIRQHTELLASFSAAGYHGLTIASANKYFFPTQSYRLIDRSLIVHSEPSEYMNLVYLEELFKLFVTKSGLAPLYDVLNPYEKAKKLLESVSVEYDSSALATVGDVRKKETLNEIMLLDGAILSENPHITLVHDLIAHAPFVYDANGDSLVADNNNDYRYYPQSHEYAVKVLKEMLDRITEKDPDAVIVIQADHGTHMGETVKTYAAAGFTPAQIVELQNSTISAVRIPEKFGGLDAPLHPLNITRELVNRFVGPNYELLNESDLPRSLIQE